MPALDPQPTAHDPLSAAALIRRGRASSTVTAAALIRRAVSDPEPPPGAESPPEPDPALASVLRIIERFKKAPRKPAE